jgi:hypothetical protein
MNDERRWEARKVVIVGAGAVGSTFAYALPHLLIQNRNFDGVLARQERWMEPQAHREGETEWLFLRFYGKRPESVRPRSGRQPLAVGVNGQRWPEDKCSLLCGLLLGSSPKPGLVEDMLYRNLVFSREAPALAPGSFTW